MAIYLNWRDNSVGSVNRFISALFHYVSNKWYPTDIIGSTIYDVFEMYAGEFASASVEISQVFDDLSLHDVRTTPIGSREIAKIYDNYGSLLGISKLFDQNYESYNTSKVLQGYRQQLRIATEAFFSGTTEEGLSKLGHAYIGIAPLFTQPVTDMPCWRLNTDFGSVKDTGEGFIFTDRYIPDVGYVVSTGSVKFNQNDVFFTSNSKLGVNTKVLSSQRFYSGMTIYIYASESVGSSFKSSIESSIKRILRADVRPRFIYSSDFDYIRFPATSSVITDTFTLSAQGYAYNHVPTSVTGAVLYFTDSDLSGKYATYGAAIYGSSSYGNSAVISLPSGFRSLDWYYDWCVLTRNGATYTMAIRSYPSASIPSTVYYSDYNTDPIDYLWVSPSSSVAYHCVFDDKDTMWDISDNRTKLSYTASIIGAVTPIFTTSRSDERIGLSTSTGSFAFTANTGTSMNLSNSFTCEMWLRGIDKTASGSLKSVVFKRETTENYTTLLQSDGYMFAVDVTGSVMQMTLRSGSIISSYSSSISDILSEEAERYHYFCYTYVSGSVSLYMDDRQLFNASGAVTLIQPTGSVFTTFFASGSGVSIDEVILTKTFFTNDQTKERFLRTRPRLRRLGIPSGSVLEYHEPRITAYASGSNEIEVHQFSVRGLPDRGLSVFDLKSSDLIRVPIFKSPYGSLYGTSEYGESIFL